MFQGFNSSTIKYYEAIRKENCKNVHIENEMLFFEGVKYPLEKLYLELYDYFCKFDIHLLSTQKRCVSSVYNDARFCKGAPVKEYFYVRFKLNTADKKMSRGSSLTHR